MGLLFASKAFVQVMVGPFVGTLTDRYDEKRSRTKLYGPRSSKIYGLDFLFVFNFRVGYSAPMFVGFLIMFCSTLSMYVALHAEPQRVTRV